MPLLAPLTALAVALAAAGDAPRTYDVKPGSTLTYVVIHRFHEVHGVTKAVEGKARVLPDGGVQVAVRARVDSFDSGNGNRDAHMREATEAGRYPYVQLKAVGTGVMAPASAPAVLDLTLKGELDFHGQTHPVDVPVKVRLEPDGRGTVDGKFALSLDAYGVERPSLLFVKVDDRVEISAHLALEVER